MRPSGSTPRPAMGVWGNKQSNNMLKTTLVQNAAASKAGSLMPAQAARNPSVVTADMGSLSLNPAASVWNPSIGPTPSKVSMMSMAAWKARTTAQSQAGSAVSVRQPFYNNICRMSNYTRRNFKKGDIIALPFHESNTNPNVNPSSDDQWQMTVWGPVYSKRRMVIVLFIYQRDMLCLPLYTFNKTGLRNKGRDILHEYVSVKNVGMPHVNQSKYPAVEVQAYKKPMHEDSTVHLTGGMKVGCNEDITWSGRLTRNSYIHLVGLWGQLNETARAEPWRE